MKNMRPNPRAGTTLVEVTIGAALLATFAGTAFLAVDLSARSYGTEAVMARLDASARQALEEATGLLQAADFDSLTPPPVAAPASSPTLDFQSSRGFVNGAVVWSPVERLVLEPEPGDADDGIDNDGDGSIDEGRLVRIEAPGTANERRVVLCNGVSEILEDEIAGNGQDDNGNGLIDEQGFCVEYSGSRLILRLTLAAMDQRRNLLLYTVSRSTTLRNTPEE